MIEFRKMPRGSYRLTHDGMTADVWKIGGEDWRYTVFDNASGHYVGADHGFADLDAACEVAMNAIGL